MNEKFSRLFLLPALQIILVVLVAQNDPHVRVPGEMIVGRVANCAVGRHVYVHLFKLLSQQGQRGWRLILARRANVTTW